MKLPGPTPRLKRAQTLAVALVVIGGIINYLDRSALAIANVPIRQELGLSATLMGVLLSAFLLAYAFAQIPIGILIDKLGPRILLGAGITLWSAMQLLCGLVTNFQQFYFARILLGASEATQFPTGIRVVSDWFHATKKGLPTGIFNASAMAGTAIAPPLLTWIMLAYGWRLMFVTAGAFGLVFAIIWIACYRSPEARCRPEELAYLRSGDTPRTTAPVNIRQWSRLFRFQTTWGMIVGSFGSSYLTWMYYTWLPGLLVMQQHMTLAQTGLYAAIPPVVGASGSMLGGTATDFFAKRGYAPLTACKIPAVLGMAAGMVVATATGFVHDNNTVVALISLSYFLTGVSSSAIWALVPAVSPPDYVGSIGSIHLMGGYVGATCAPIVTGFIADVTGIFQLALVIGGLIQLGGAIAILLLIHAPISGRDLDAANPNSIPG
jgi:MFS family permease